MMVGAYSQASLKQTHVAHVEEILTLASDYFNETFGSSIIKKGLAIFATQTSSRFPL